jgi:4-hydroxybenzoate polyprenyltransferase
MHNHNKTPETPVADAVKGNWVDAYAPIWARPYLRLSRADRPVGTWLLLLPCWWGLALAAMQTGGFRPFDIWIASGCAIGAFLMRGAGCTWNDIVDRDFDAAVARTKTRPIPSGQVTVKQAMIWLCLQAGLAFCVLVSFNELALLMGLAALIPVVIYPFAKRFTWWPQAFLGVAFNWGVLVAWVAQSGAFHISMFFLYASGIAWTLFYDTIYAHQDAEDDALIGVKSTARLFGDATYHWLFAFASIAAICLHLAVWFAAPSGGQWVAIGAVGVLISHLMWQIHKLDIKNADMCLRLFRSNKTVGLWVALFFAIAAWV